MKGHNEASVFEQRFFKYTFNTVIDLIPDFYSSIHTPSQTIYNHNVLVALERVPSHFNQIQISDKVASITGNVNTPTWLWAFTHELGF